MPLGVEERAAVVARDDLRARKATRAVRRRHAGTRPWGRRGRAARTESAREVDVLEPELELARPSADGLEVAAADEQAGARRLVDGDDGRSRRARAAAVGSADQRSRRGRPQGRKCAAAGTPPASGRRPGRRAARQLRPRPGSARRASQRRDRFVGGEDVIVEEEHELGATQPRRRGCTRWRGPRARRAARPRRRAAPRSASRGPVDRAVVDDDHALEQRRARGARRTRARARASPGSRRSASITASHTIRGRGSAGRQPALGPADAHVPGACARPRRAARRAACSTGAAAGARSPRSCASRESTSSAFDYREELPSADRRAAGAIPRDRGPPQPRARRAAVRRRLLRHRALLRRARARARTPEASVDEIRRVLRPGGTFYVTNLPNRYSYTERAARLLGLYYHGQLPNDRVYTEADRARAARERHGFRVEELRRSTCSR